MFCGGHGRSIRGVRDRHPSGGCFGDIDGIDTDPGPAQADQPWGPIEHRGVPSATPDDGDDGIGEPRVVWSDDFVVLDHEVVNRTIDVNDAHWCSLVGSEEG